MNLSRLPFFLPWLGIIAYAGPFASARGAEWKLAGSETLPSPGEGIAHVAQTVHKADGGEATLHFVTFDASAHDLRVIDQGTSGRATLGAVMESNKCLAGINGGYFQPDFEPVGMLLSGGRVVHKLAHARLLSGALVATTNHLKLLRSTDPLPGKNAHEALQSGPFLVDGGKVVPGLNEVRSARRTAILNNGKGRWALVSCSPVTLAELGAILSEPRLLPGGLKAERALNLDGGSSTAMWVRQPGGAPFYLNEIGIVRDFVGIVER